MRLYMHLKRFIQIISFSLSCMIFLSSCHSLHRAKNVVQVPFYKYPNKVNSPNIELVTIITDPFIQDLYQGKLLNEKLDNESFLETTTNCYRSRW